MTWRPLTVAERQLAWVWGGLVLATIALQPLWVFLAPRLRPCLFHELTGVPCPSCGATRGLLAFIDGRVLDGVAYNPLVAAAAVLFMIGGVVAPLWAWKVNKLPRLQHPLPRWVRYGIVAVILVNWVYLIVVL